MRNEINKITNTNTVQFLIFRIYTLCSLRFGMASYTVIVEYVVNGLYLYRTFPVLSTTQSSFYSTGQVHPF